VRCQALEITGRIARLRDLGTAREAFSRALRIAEAADLPVWRLRALHELGTIDLLDHGGTELLSRARRTAAEAGAFSTAALLDLQLAAAYDFRFEFAGSARHARLALAAAKRLAMPDARAKALIFLAEAHGMRQERADMEECVRQAQAIAPENRFIEAFGWGGCRAMSALCRGELPAAITAFSRGAAILRGLAQPEPAMFRAIWPLALAAAADGRAAAELADTRRTNVTLPRFNRGVLGYAEAVLAGRRGEGGRGGRRRGLRPGRRHPRPPVPAAGGGTGAGRRLGRAGAVARVSARRFRRQGLRGLAAWCQALLAAPSPDRLAGLGITLRESEILELVAAGLPNKEIAVRLHLSHRTVEKHIESLLRKAGASSRTMLVAVTGPWPHLPASPVT
jgi:DNA-binding CsgD family transcriptional regulator